MTGSAAGPSEAICRAAASTAGRSPAARTAVLLGLGLLFIGFVALGTWQVERRTWKLDLIDRVEHRIHAAPVPAPGRNAWPHLNAGADEYRHVSATGRFLDPAETLVQAVTELGAGHWVMTPLQTETGDLILVNRGFVADGWQHSASSPPTASATEAAPRVTVDGLLRLSEPRGGFLRHNDPAAGRWFSRDVTAIAASRGLRGAVAPYFIDAGATPAAAGSPTSAPAAASSSIPASTEPIGGMTVVAFANNHLVYALTWYGLAFLVLVAARHVSRDATRNR